LALGFGLWVWLDSPLSHEVEELAWDLIESLFGKKMGIVLELVVRHKLHNISFTVLPEGLRVERLVVTVEDVHVAEVGIAHSDDNDSDRLRRATDDLVNRFLHVVDDTVGEQEQDVVLLVLLVHNFRLSNVVDLAQDFSKMRRPVQLSVLDGMLVDSDHLVESVHTRVEDVSVESEAVRGALGVGRNSATKAIQVDLLAAVVELEDAANIFDGLQVLVVVGVEVMKRISALRVTVRKSEIDSDREVDFTASEDVLQEGVTALNFQVLKVEQRALADTDGVRFAFAFINRVIL